MTTPQDSAINWDAISQQFDAMNCTECGVHSKKLEFYPIDLCKPCCLIHSMQWEKGELAVRCEWCWSAKACASVAMWLCKHCLKKVEEHRDNIQNSIDEIEWKPENKFPIANDYGESRDWRKNRGNANHRKKLPAFL